MPTEIRGDISLYFAIAALLGVPEKRMKLDLDTLEELASLPPEVRQALAGWVERSRARLDRYATTAQLAAAWSVSPSFIRERARSGELRGLRSSRRGWVFPPEAIETFIAERTRPAQSEGEAAQ